MRSPLIQHTNESLTARNARVAINTDKVLSIIDSGTHFKIRRQFRSINAVAADVSLQGLVQLAEDMYLLLELDWTQAAMALCIKRFPR